MQAPRIPILATNMLLTAMCTLLLLPWSRAADEESDLADLLAEAREISYQRSWHEADRLLDRIEPHIETAALREQADYQLLRARHLSLADQSAEAMELIDSLLEQPIADDQRMRALQFNANAAVLLRQYEAAFSYLGQALSLDVSPEASPAVIATYNMASYMLGRVGETERALEFGRRAIEHALATESPADECVSRQRVAPVYKWAGMHTQAEREYRTGIAVCRKIGNDLFAGVLEHGLAGWVERNSESSLGLKTKANSWPRSGSSRIPQYHPGSNRFPKSP